VQCSSAAYSLAWCAPQPLLVVGLDAELALYAVRANPVLTPRIRVSTPATLPPHMLAVSLDAEFALFSVCTAERVTHGTPELAQQHYVI
jgi:hypothetical protein